MRFTMTLKTKREDGNIVTQRCVLVDGKESMQRYSSSQTSREDVVYSRQNRSFPVFVLSPVVALGSPLLYCRHATERPLLHGFPNIWHLDSPRFQTLLDQTGGKTEDRSRQNQRQFVLFKNGVQDAFESPARHFLHAHAQCFLQAERLVHVRKQNVHVIGKLVHGAFGNRVYRFGLQAETEPACDAIEKGLKVLAKDARKFRFGFGVRQDGMPYLFAC